MDARAGFFTQMLQAGVMSINEVRREEDKNPIKNGDVHLVQVNQISLDKIEDYSDSISNNNINEGRENDTTGEPGE